MSIDTNKRSAIEFRNLMDAFPDFSLGTLPAIPEGWEDTSWKNDACPSFGVANLRIFIDYADPKQRELGPDTNRFLICGEDGDLILATDDWNEVLQRIGELTCEHHRDTGRGVCAHCGKVL